MKTSRKRVLIYYPPNKRAIALNAVVDLLLNGGNDVYVLTQDPAGLLHKDLEPKFKAGKRVFASSIDVKSGMQFYYKHIRSLITFCKLHQIDVVFSHLQSGNLVAVTAAKFLPGIKIIPFRHHFQYFKKFKLDYLKSNRNELIGEKIVNKLSSKVVVPSTTVKNGMVEFEKVPPEKVIMVPYIYNFGEYPPIDWNNVNEILVVYRCKLLLLMSSRFIEPKRHELVIRVLAEMIKKENYDIKMLLLDDGPLKPTIKNLVEELGLKENVFFIGYTDNIMDYMAACDLLVHPSLSEASNSSVKEMGIAGRTAIVCSGVGDFDDYIEHKKNGYLIDPLKSESGLIEAIEHAYHNKSTLLAMGNVLKENILAKFSPSPFVFNLYQSLIND